MQRITYWHIQGMYLPVCSIKISEALLPEKNQSAGGVDTQIIYGGGISGKGGENAGARIQGIEIIPILNNFVTLKTDQFIGIGKTGLEVMEGTVIRGNKLSVHCTNQASRQE